MITDNKVVIYCPQDKTYIGNRIINNNFSNYTLTTKLNEARTFDSKAAAKSFIVRTLPIAVYFDLLTKDEAFVKEIIE